MNSQFESQLKTSENGSASQVLKKKKVGYLSMSEVAFSDLIIFKIN